MNPRVCHLSTAHHGPDPRIFLKECTASVAGGFETHLVIRGTAEIDDNPGVILHDPGEIEGGRLRRMLHTAYRVYRLARAVDADIYQFHDPELLPWGLLLRRRGARVIYDAHEDIPKYFRDKHWIPRPLRAPVAALSTWVEEWIARRLDAVVTAAPGMTERFQRCGCTAIDLSNYPDLTAFPRRPYRPEPLVCFAGNMVRDRNIDQMVNAAAQAGVEIALAGKFHDAALERECRALPAWRRARWLGFLGRDEMIAWMHRSVAGLMVFDGSQHFQPTKLFEYMAAGIPVIASDLPRWVEFVEGNGIGICVPPRDVDALAAAIRRLVDDPALAARMGEAGRRLVETRYSWQAEQAKLWQLYRSLGASERS